MDRLDALLSRFAVSARLFHSGPLCGVTDFTPSDERGQLHLVQQGEVQVSHGRRQHIAVREPSLVFYPRPLAHRFVTDPEHGAQMACAHVAFRAGAIDPVARALPPVVVMPLARLGDARALLDLLFAEAFDARCGRQAVVDRLFEVVLIHVLRALMADGAVDQGLLAGLAHPQLARALVALHESPAEPWTLERLAAAAGLSRSRFAAIFRDTVGATPGDYLAGWRICLAQDLLRRGQPLKAIAPQVGYAGVAALSRAFRGVSGQSPRAWKRALD